MNVPNIGSGTGSTAVLSRPQRNDVVVALREVTGSGAEGNQARTSAADSDAMFTRIGWFDVNGDGSIDGRSALAGGDGTLLLPQVVKVATHSRPARTAPSNDKPVRAEQLDGKAEDKERAETDGVAEPAPKGAAAEVHTRQAIAAYERYGQPTTEIASSGSERAA